MKYKLISKDDLSSIIEHRTPIGRFYSEEVQDLSGFDENMKFVEKFRTLFIACDNSSGDAFIEEFNTINLCEIYLDGEFEPVENNTLHEDFKF